MTAVAGQRRWRGVGIRGLLLAINAFALALPLAVILLLRIFDDQLIRRTEAQLIGQSVLIAEAWREAFVRERGTPTDPVEWLPPGIEGLRYFPVEPILRLDQGVLPPTEEAPRVREARDDAAERAGRAVEPMLQRAVRMNLSSARILDAEGCVVASSRGQHGVCLDDLEEVARALGGEYAAVLRERVSDEAAPRLDSISRRGRVRVYTALPVFSDGEVIAVVRMARTAIDPAKALWFDRHRLFAVLVGCALLVAVVSLFLSRTLSRPLRSLTDSARSMARGEGRASAPLPALAPHELREVSRALDQTMRQLSDRADYISEFAENLSHELKTPITGIRGAAELLAQEWEAMRAEERARFLGNIQADAARMERLAARLLALARIQSDPEQAERIPLRSFVENLCASYPGGLVLRYEAPEDAVLRIPPDHLESALRNLLDNAVRHGAGEAVDFVVDRRGEQTRFRVRDRGPGISEGNRDKIFERFFTTERDRGGTGLGLAIVRAVAETRGGSLDFETGPEGTCFELLL